MNKLVTLEQIKGLMSGTIYAEKYEEVEMTIERLGVSQFRSVKTGILFDARNERIGLIDEQILLNYSPQKEKRNFSSGTRTVNSSKNQLELFR